MATTEPDGIWSPDNLNNFDWVAHFAQNADSVQTALDGLRAEFEVEDTGWIGLSTQNSFTANPNDIPRYRRIGNQVYLRGQLYRSTAPNPGVVAMTLPAEARPAYPVWGPTVVFFGASSDSPVMVQLLTNGEVIVASRATRTTGVGYALGGMSFLTT